MQNIYINCIFSLLFFLWFASPLSCQTNSEIIFNQAILQASNGNFKDSKLSFQNADFIGDFLSSERAVLLINKYSTNELDLATLKEVFTGLKLLINENEVSKSIDVYKKALNKNPSFDELYLFIAVSYAVLNNYVKAIQYYNIAEEKMPRFSDIYLNRGNLYFNTDYPKKALEDYNFCITLDSLDYQAFCNRGYLHSKEDNYLLSLSDLNKSIELKNNYSPSYLNRGVTYFKMKNYIDALRDFSKIIDLNPNNLIASQNRIWCYIYLGQLNEACTELNYLLQIKADIDVTIIDFLKTKCKN